MAWGALAKTSSGTYVVGRRLWDIGLLAPVQAGLVETASPFLHDLYGATLATVHLAVRDGAEVLYLDRLGGHASVPVVSTVGSRLPMHATGVGKVLLAHAPADVQGEVLGDLPRVTPYTVTQPGTLRRQLSRVVRDGYATTVEEMSLGACSVAVPIRRGPDVVASLGIVVASLKKDRPRLVSALQVAAHGIGRQLVRQFQPAEPGLAAAALAAFTDPMTDRRVQVAIVGAGPAGMLLAHLLAAEGIESAVVEIRSEDYVASRIRAGILEQSTVDLLHACGLGDRLTREGDQHRGISLQWPDERHHLDFVDLTGRSVWVYGQTEVQKDLVAAASAATARRSTTRSRTPPCTTSRPTGRP